jgi:P4 family phage/plasmid primase-like protien
LALDSYVKILGYRNYTTESGKEKSKQLFWEMPYNFQDHQTLYNNLEVFLDAQIPTSERFNLHYTINHVPQGASEKNTVAKIDIIPIDIDYTIKDKTEEYIQVVEHVVGLTRDNFVTVSTGNGLQCVFLLEKPFLDAGGYLSIKKSYILLCDEIDRELQRRNLIQTLIVEEKKKTTKCDTQILRVGTLRLPETRNIKKGWADTKCVFVTRHMLPQSLEKLRLYPEVMEKTKSPKITSASYWGQTDSKQIFKECAAIKNFKDKKGKVSYAEWFSSISVVSRLNDVDGEKLCHEISSGDPSYSESETQNLIEATRINGGPHTCETFSQSFEGCKDCKYYKTKLRSPINLRSSEFLSYEVTGFHREISKGVYKPYYKQVVQKFVQMYNYKILQETGSMYYFDQAKNHWDIMPMLKAKSEINKLFTGKPDDLASTRTTQETFQHLTLNNSIPDNEFLEHSSGKVNFKNGHIEIRGNELKFFPVVVDSFKQYFTFALPFNYDPNAKCPQFMDFLDAVSLSREDIQVSLCEFMGYVMSNDDYWAHKFLMLEGVGANGKSVLLDLLRYLVGEGNYSALGIKDMADDQKKAGLVGKIANISDEQPKKNFLDSSDLKNLTSGGDFNYKRLYLQPGIAKCRAKFVFSTNHSFTTNDTSNGTKRRYHPIPFEANFDPEAGPTARPPDVKILQKLKSEASGIFNYCMTLYMEAKRRGEFTVSDATKEILKEFKINTSPIGMYLNECMDIDKYKILTTETAKLLFRDTKPYGPLSEGYWCRIPVDIIRHDYNAWAKDQGFKGEYNSVSFGKEFRLAVKSFITNKNVLDELYKISKLDNKTKMIFVGKWSPFIEV